MGGSILSHVYLSEVFSFGLRGLDFLAIQLIARLSTIILKLKNISKNKENVPGRSSLTLGAMFKRKASINTILFFRKVAIGKR
jgi:hypothetical protein